MTGYSNCLWLLRESELPFIEIVETSCTGGGYTEIDKNNHLYSNIDQIQPPYDVQLVQSIKVYARKERSDSCLLKVEYDYSGNHVELDKVTRLIADDDSE